MGIKKGVLYGVGVGPGEPELMTLRACRTIEKCEIIASPRTKSGEMLALEIAKQAVDFGEKTIVPLDFTMSNDKETREKSYVDISAIIAEFLDSGKDVAMLNLGDVSVFSTYCYIADELKRRGYETVMVPGVTSFSAVAAKLNISLTDIDKPLTIIPGSGMDIEKALELPGNKVIMKSAGKLGEVRNALKARGLLGKASLVADCGLPDEKVVPDWTKEEEIKSYFTTIVVKE